MGSRGCFAGGDGGGGGQCHRALSRPPWQADRPLTWRVGQRVEDASLEQAFQAWAQRQIICTSYPSHVVASKGTAGASCSRK